MTRRINRATNALIAVSFCAVFALSSAAVADDYEKDVLGRSSLDLSESSSTPFSPQVPTADLGGGSAFSNNNAADLLEENSEVDGSIVVRNAKVEFPIGEDYEATISANGQGLLAELGLTEVDENGEVVLNEDGTSKRRFLSRGLIVKKGDILGKQQDDELVQERIVAEQELKVARKEAEKQLEVEVAEAAARVAQASYKRAESLNKAMPGSVSPEEVQEKYYDWLRASKSIEKAKYDLEINQEKVKVSEARVNATDVQIRNRKFRAPISGVIDEVFQNEGQWLREGDNVLRIIRLDKVQVTGAIDAEKYAPENIDKKKVVITVKRPGMADQTLEGQIVYVRQVVESGHYYFYANVQNAQTEAGYWLLNPGALVTVSIQKDASPASVSHPR